jgi:serine/threonine protein kinase
MQLERIGPYKIVRLLGKGGMGAVYEGLHEAIERRVAVKVLHSELGRRADMATRFINEARAVNRIDHPGLVQVSDFGQLPDGTAYIVMEFLKGETLGQRLKRINARLPVTDVIRLGRQMGSALAAAHDKDIVHRDLKPDNIMIVPNADVPGGEQIKILDFGIAKVAEAQSGISEAHTRADALLGTPRYMSPEQCKGSGNVDAKSDVYSLGVIFYEVLAGRPPFPGSAHGELIVQHMMNEPPPLQQFVDPTASEVLIQLVHAMLRKDRDTRPNMRQVVAEMDKMGGYMSGVYGIVQPPPSGVSMPGLTPGMPTPAPGSLSGHPSFPGSQSVRSITMPGSSQSVPTPVPGSSTLAAATGQAPLAARPRWPIAVAIGSIVGAVAVGVVLVTTLKPTPPELPTPPPKVVKQPEVEAPKKLVKSRSPRSRPAPWWFGSATGRCSASRRYSLAIRRAAARRCASCCRAISTRP